MSLTQREPVRSAEHRIVGFDVKPRLPAFPEQWSAERIDTFLLRTDVARVLSVDTAVWASEIPAPGAHKEWRGVLDLWSDLGRMRDFLRTTDPGLLARGCEVALTLAWGLLDEEEKRRCQAERLEATQPDEVDPSWTFLGYDVADAWLVSGLSNCGYSSSELEAFRRSFGGHLNSEHLFSTLDQALAFKQASDARVPEHAPFFVYGLFLVNPLAIAAGA